MDTDRDEKWLKAFKDSVENYSEPAPADFWNNLHRSIPQKSRRKRVKFPYWSAAAAILVAIMLLLPKWEGREPVVSIPDNSNPHNGEYTSPLAHNSSNNREPEVLPSHSTPNRTIAKTEIALEPVSSREPSISEIEDVPGQTSPEPGEISKTEEVSEKDSLQKQIITEPAPNGAGQNRRRSVKSVSDKVSRRHYLAFSAGNGALSQGRGANLPPVYQNSVAATPYNLLNIGGHMDSKVNMVGGNKLEVIGNMNSYKNYEYSHKPPLKLGVTFAMEVSRRIFVETGISYQYLSSKFVRNGSKMSQHLHYVGLPVKANIYFVKAGNFTAYAGAGYLIEKCVYGTVNGDRINLKKWQNSLQGGVGAQLALGGGAYLCLEPGVTWYFAMDEEFVSYYNGILIKTLYSESPFGFTLSGGVRFLF